MNSRASDTSNPSWAACGGLPCKTIPQLIQTWELVSQNDIVSGNYELRWMVCLGAHQKARVVGEEGGRGTARCSHISLGAYNSPECKFLLTIALTIGQLIFRCPISVLVICPQWTLPLVWFINIIKFSIQHKTAVGKYQFSPQPLNSRYFMMDIVGEFVTSHIPQVHMESERKVSKK